MGFRSLVGVCLAVLVLTAPSMASADRLEEVAGSMVFLIGPPSPAGQSDIGSGFFVVHGGVPTLVTAEHVARKMTVGATAVIRGPDGNALRMAVHELTGSAGAPTWRPHPAADLAVLCLSPVSAIRPHLERRFIWSNTILTEASAPPRSMTVTVFGFPMALGVAGKFSPISRETKAASGLLEYRRGDKQAQATFFVTQDPTIGGFSGAPVFDTGLPYSTAQEGIRIENRPLQIVGVVHATVSDATGGKLGLITPGHLLLELLPMCK
jgi:Trypsin-like peptidase domain